MRSVGNSFYKSSGAVKILQDLKKRPETLKHQLLKFEKHEKSVFRAFWLSLQAPAIFLPTVYTVVHVEFEPTYPIS